MTETAHIFDIRFPLSRRIKMWNELKPDTIKKHKEAILAYIEIFDGGTYEQIYEGLNAVGYKVKMPTVVGRLSELTKENMVDTTEELDGKTLYKVKAGQLKMELK